MCKGLENRAQVLWMAMTRVPRETAQEERSDTLKLMIEQDNLRCFGML